MKSIIQRFEYHHKTTTGNVYPVEIGYQPVHPMEIPFDHAATVKACQDGCNNYGRNGGCPPYAPNFANLRVDYPYGVIIFARLFTRYYPPKVLAGNYYIRTNSVESMLSRLMTRIGHKAASTIGGIFLGTGHCSGCRKCAFKSGNTECVNPDKRIFSMESTGILVGDLVTQELDFSLQWWNPKEPDYIPEFMTKVILLLSTHPIDLQLLAASLPKSE